MSFQCEHKHLHENDFAPQDYIALPGQFGCDRARRARGGCLARSRKTLSRKYLINLYTRKGICKMLGFILQDHINEVLAKWEQIDDEIWAKIIVFEKNRRVAKAYARSNVITINGSKHGFDGVR